MEIILDSLEINLLFIYDLLNLGNYADIISGR